MATKKEITAQQKQEFLGILKVRFEKNKNLHPHLEWNKVEAKLENAPAEKLWSLLEMEKTGGGPDVINYNATTDEFTFYDCATESPKERSSFCYDQEALDKRKANKPKNSAVALATEMGVELLTEEEYRGLQKLGNFDNKTSSWLKTPENIRKLGGAIFGDFRFDTVFVYHNGAESYYAARAFRGLLRV